jgi:hypothetical protein
MLPIASLIVAGCYLQPMPGYQPAPQQFQSAPPQPMQAQPGAQPPSQTQRTVWQGRYTCRQGVTAVKLTLDGNCNGVQCSFGALFEFGPLAENPTIAHGAYRMAGEGHANAQGELELSLQPTQWIQQPANYAMVGLVASADAQQAQMRGRMDDPSCGGVELARVQ